MVNSRFSSLNQVCLRQTGKCFENCHKSYAIPLFSKDFILIVIKAMKPEDELKMLELDLSIYLMALGYERRHLFGRINGIKIEIFSNEQTPPHFHITAPGFKASFRIDNCELHEGEVNSSTYKRIKEFYSKNRDQLIDLWNKLRPSNCPVGPVSK